MAWDDIIGIVEYDGIPVAPTIEQYRDTQYCLPFFRTNANVTVSVRIDPPHRWDPRRCIRPHLYVVPMANRSGNVRIRASYTWARCRTEIPSISEWITVIVDTAFSPADRYQRRLIELGPCFANHGACEAAVLFLCVERPALSDPADTYVALKDHGTPQANLGLLSASAHYEPVKSGTQNEHGPV